MSTELPELVLLHGWGMNRQVWQPFAELAAGRYRVHALDLPGHGGSDMAAAGTLDAWADALLDSTPAGGIWVGWSLGGLLALRAKMRRPEAISGLVMLAATPRFVHGDGWDCAVSESVFEGFRQALSADPDKTLLRFLSLQVQRTDRSRALLAQLRRQLRSLPAPTPAGLEVGLQLLRDTDLRGALPALPGRSLWLLGERDTLVPRGLGEQLTRLAPRARVVSIPGAGHALPFSHPRDCLQRLEDHLYA